MAQVLLFGGTTEGRILAEYLSSKCIPTCVCVATEYGEKLLIENKYITVKAKRLTDEEMVLLLDENDFDIVIDATHPFAVVVSDNIKKACEKKRVEYIRILRDEDKGASIGIWVNTIEEAVSYLKNKVGNILITTGSNELKEFTKLDNFSLRCYPRVLASIPVMEKCIGLGFLDSHLICMQGPFNKDFNIALLKQINASYMVTKESGSTGGFEDKISAAKETNVTPIIIGRPKELSGISVFQAKELLRQRYKREGKTKVTLVGIGMGNINNLTLEAVNAIKECELIIGSSRVLNTLKEFNKSTFLTVKNEEIISYLEEHKDYKDIVIAFSGDIGFYSGAKRLRPFLSEYEVISISGISTPIYFLDKLGFGWEDVTLASLHGRTLNIIQMVKNNNKVFVLLDSENNINKVCEELIANNLDVNLYVGENLSYESERIVIGTPKELVGLEFDGMSVLYIENRNPIKSGKELATYGLPDEIFIRSKVPMTKSEVRSISLSKLQLRKNSVVYDVGAGTGSVSIEAAMIASEGIVYAIEKKDEAVALIKENRSKFEVANLDIIHSEASKVIDILPKPTHVFIGGSSGNLKKILGNILKDNKVRVVINVIALESLVEVMNLLKDMEVEELEITEVTIAKGKAVASYHLMMGQNPVYVISFTAGGNGI